ncbi:MAG: HEPN domain-containing protein [Calditrichaeota bacterium]|nr:HEPN domain-containing protein [Calditrichota bacterium]
MSFDWEEYKTLAEHLHNNPDEEIEDAYYRTAISRAYYAAFHITLHKMMKKYRFTSLTSNAHVRLLNFLKEKKSDNPVIGKAWKNLKRLKDQRQSADYDDEYDFEYQDLPRSSYIAIAHCENVFNAISELK